jgi:RNA-directed DNA polymerase
MGTQANAVAGCMTGAASETTKTADRTEAAKPILGMSSSEARDFLLKPESYCGIDLPMYFDFNAVLRDVATALRGKSLREIRHNPRDHEGVNYTMLANKDGRHAWRPLQVIHPALYVSLVEAITTVDAWKTITDRFNELRNRNELTCMSIPVSSATDHRDKAAQIFNWWHGIEQRALELALDFKYVLHADITDCYAAIYTHSIAWAMHGKQVAKSCRRDTGLIGNVIDSHIQDMRHGQTNGIPQGSVLMDFVSEMVLGYADLDLGNRLAELAITDFHILRYRDDYRVFVQSPQIGDKILKTLTEVLIDLGLKLNASKTTHAQSIIVNSIKPDKRAWMRTKQLSKDPQKRLLAIHAHGQEFPQSGSLVAALSNFHRRITRAARIRNPLVLISIVTDIAYDSPRTFPVCAAIISRLLGEFGDNGRKAEVIKRIHRKLSQLPNVGHMEVWLQRISHPVGQDGIYSELMCKLVDGHKGPLWNSEWICDSDLLQAIDCSKIINTTKLGTVTPVMQPREVDLFSASEY